ncbi:Anoctamin-4 [Desmophyllum pertusum]|uniref:Anoctamin n=1 Tax=Desmophyllum pertusum TaxID=174260 RepID=A0A9W9YGK7_9CNID|nr:Anoctamin-4 [Desmophyllum pertusum]
MFQRRKDPVDRGAYSELSQTDVPLETESEALAKSSTAKSYNISDGQDGGGDHSRRIDYVLIFETCKEKDEKDDETKKEAEGLARARRSFERRLQKKGLVLQRESVIAEQDPEVERHFVLIHAPWELLAKRAEEMRLKLPLQPNDVQFSSWIESLCGTKILEKLASWNPLIVHDATVREKADYFMGDTKKHSLCSRSPVRGLNRLVLDGAYIAHYPLHEGTDKLKEGESPVNDRQRLKRDWARLGRCFKFQPYDAIKDYFGHQIGLYFAWLGFYTAMLVPLAIVALIVFLYGIISTSSHIPVQDICDEKNEGVWYMCPLCDRQCSYWSLAPTTCRSAYITHIFDNDGTLILGLVASIWVTLFLEFWKRRQASIAQEWHTTDFETEDEPFRPEYVRSLTEEEINPFKPDPITGKIVFRASKMKQYRRYATIFSVISFMIFLAIAAIIGVLVFRVSTFATLSSNPDRQVQQLARILTSGLAAFINLLAIMVLKYLYQKLALWLTNWENPATLSSFEYSFTWKMALFEFVNTFASIIYIAFFKSELVVGSPGRYKRIWELTEVMVVASKAALCNCLCRSP